LAVVTVPDPLDASAPAWLAVNWVADTIPLTNNVALKLGSATPVTLTFSPGFR